MLWAFFRGYESGNNLLESGGEHKFPLYSVELKKHKNGKYIPGEAYFKERNLGSLLPSQGRWGLQRGERFFPLLAV